MELKLQLNLGKYDFSLKTLPLVPGLVQLVERVHICRRLFLNAEGRGFQSDLCQFPTYISQLSYPLNVEIPPKKLSS